MFSHAHTHLLLLTPSATRTQPMRFLPPTAQLRSSSARGWRLPRQLARRVGRGGAAGKQAGGAQTLGQWGEGEEGEEGGG